MKDDALLATPNPQYTLDHAPAAELVAKAPGHLLERSTVVEALELAKLARTCVAKE